MMQDILKSFTFLAQIIVPILLPLLLGHTSLQPGHLLQRLARKGGTQMQLLSDLVLGSGWPQVVRGRRPRCSGLEKTSRKQPESHGSA